MPADNNCAGVCSIRDAFNLATGADTITLPAGTFNLNPQFGGELDLSGATVNGAGARSTIIDGGDVTRVLVTSNDVTTGTAPQVSGVTIRNGNAAGSGNGGIGGGILVLDGTLGLVNSAVLSSS